MDLHEENIYKVKAENLMAENHALKEENNDILQRLKAAEDLSKQQKTEMSLLKAEIKALKEEKIKTKEELNKLFEDLQIKYLLEKNKRKAIQRRQAIQRRKASSGYSKRTVTCGEDKGLCSHRFIIDRSIPYIIYNI